MSEAVLRQWTVHSQKQLQPGIYRISFAVPEPFDPEPGQFFHLRTSSGWQPLLRRPISLCDWDEAKRVVSLIYRRQGEGTGWLAQRAEGDVVEVMGPLGQGFPLPQTATDCLLVGGGIGVPPLFYLAKKLRQRGCRVTAVLGFASASQSFLREEFEQLGQVVICTEDGSLGIKGRVTDGLEQLERRAPYTFFACGPTPMLKAVKMQLSADPLLQEGYLSLEERMGCGIGACLACVLPAPGEKGYVKICSDGPVFPYQEVLA